jgi:peptide-methionine (R)-S-oxide reductase
MPTRRNFLAAGAALSGAAVIGAGARPRAFAAVAADPAFAVVHTDAEWRKLLSREAYAVLRGADTETPFTSQLLHEERAGVFVCAGCSQQLFSSKTKFDSGTGWPSFWAPLPAAVDTSADTSFGMVRTEVHCSRCGGHLGHVFPDGPKPTGLRYCMNGVALAFTPGAA